MQKISIDTNVHIPMPVAIVGTEFMGKPNFMTVGWITRVNASPPMVGFAIRKNRRTARSIVQNKQFSICFPGKDLVRKADYVGMVSADMEDKSDVFQVEYGDMEKAPLIKEAGLCMECKFVEQHEYPSNIFIVAEIVSAWCNKDLVIGNAIDFVKMRSFFLTMPDNKYWGFGRSYGNAWEVKSL